MSDDAPDLLAALRTYLDKTIEQRAIDNQPCETCGGDRLRADFTDPDRCHVKRKEADDVR